MTDFVMELPSEVSEAMAALRGRGYSSYVVGGSVRDAMRGITPHDYDIATNASPDEMKKCFSAYKTIDTGLKHGTLTVMIRGISLEVTTFRIDGVYTDNRHQSEVFFTDSIADDLARRDFTVNAMAYSQSGGLYDLFGGKEHLEEKIIVCVGNPYDRFREDGLRILRALRFASVLEFSIEEETAQAAKDLKELLVNISAERIYSEFAKLICGKGAYPILLKYRDIIEAFVSLECDDIEYQRRCKSISNAVQNLPVRLAILFGNSDIARENMTRLKTSNFEKSRVIALASIAKTNLQDKIAVKKLISRFGKDTLADFCEMRRAEGAADAEAVAKIYQEIIDKNECTAIAMLDIKGTDIIELGVLGKNIGVVLKELLSEVIEGKCENTRQSLLSLASVIIAGINIKEHTNGDCE